MAKFVVTVHPQGLHPLEAVRAWHMHKEEGSTIREVREQVTNIQGETPSASTVWSAVKRVDDMAADDFVPASNYSNCGRKPKLTEEQEVAVVAFVKKWRHKRFCTCAYIKHVFKLKVTKRTIANVLGRHGFRWRPVPKIRGLTKEELEKRQVWVDKHIHHSSTWWVQNMNLVLDGVTLTMPPRPLSSRQRHAAQSIRHMWVKDGEKFSEKMLTYNRYGIQLGTKVPFWGGFTGRGKFTLRLYTARPKMLKEEWQAKVPVLKRAVANADEPRATKRAKIWHDNEKFLKAAASQYRQHGMHMENFPPNSGDLNPIETVWAWLRRCLAERELEDMDAGRVLTTTLFRRRVSQILTSFEQPAQGQRFSPLEKLVRGMPRRLEKARRNHYGRCGK